jgi:regulator of sirC expression with transglutaminase-like and TPR domain
VKAAFDEFTEHAGKDLDRVLPGSWLEIGAALIARDAHPDLRVSEPLAHFDALAAGLGPLNKVPIEEAARAIAHHVYEVHGFRGNEQDYGDPRNSYIDDVLARRLGIPITLAMVVLAVARRVGVTARGVSFPGHFLVRYERANGGALIVDPFPSVASGTRGGRALSLEELTRMLKRSSPGVARVSTKHLEPASCRSILVRVLRNLQQAHMARGDLPRALVAAARIVTLVPREGWAVRDRGLLQAQLGAPEGARVDLLRYLELSPEATDVHAVRAVLARIGSARGPVN